MSTGCTCRNGRGNPKVQHKTHEAALSAAMVQAKAGRPANVYACPHSDRWHVTTHPKENT